MAASSKKKTRTKSSSPKKTRTSPKANPKKISTSSQGQGKVSRNKKLAASAIALSLLGANYYRQKKGISFDELNPWYVPKQTLKDKLLGRKPKSVFDKIFGGKRETRFDRFKTKQKADNDAMNTNFLKALTSPPKSKILGSKSVSSGPSAPALSAPPAYSA